jgi:hypothetical protein
LLFGILTQHCRVCGVAQPNVKGTIFGIEVQLSDSVRMEFGSEDNNTVERKTYAQVGLGQR